MSAYGWQVVVGSLFGFVTLGIAFAAFVPLIIMNAVNRRNGASPGFVLVWIAGDIVNTYGLARAGAPETQVALAVWYGLADVALFIQLLWFGHRACSLRQPKSTYALISKLERRRKPWWYKLTRRFRNFGYFDDFVLLALFVLVATTAWGATLLSKMAANPDEEPFSAVHEWDLTSFLLGLTSALLFSGARIPEFIVGFIRDHRQLEPEQGQSDDDPIFAFLILENLTNIIAIVTRSFDDTYLLMETPWLVGSGLSIVIDAALMYCIRRWRRNYYRDSNPKWLAKKAEREEHAKLAQGLDAEIEEREEEGLLIDILTDVNMYRRDGAPAAAKLGFWARLFGDPDLEAYKERKVVAENFNARRHDHHILDLLHRIETRHPPYDRFVLKLVRTVGHSDNDSVPGNDPSSRHSSQRSSRRATLPRPASSDGVDYGLPRPPHLEKISSNLFRSPSTASRRSRKAPPTPPSSSDEHGERS